GLSMSASCWRLTLNPADRSLIASLRCLLKAATRWAVGVTTPPSARRWRVALMKKIADAGLLIGFLDRKDEHHKWAVRIFETESPPFYTAETILAEVAAVLGTPDDVLRMLEVGDLVLALDLAKEV